MPSVKWFSHIIGHFCQDALRRYVTKAAMKVIRFFFLFLGTIDIFTRYHGNPSSSWQAASHKDKTVNTMVALVRGLMYACLLCYAPKCFWHVSVWSKVVEWPTNSHHYLYSCTVSMATFKMEWHIYKIKGRPEYLEDICGVHRSSKQL